MEIKGGPVHVEIIVTNDGAKIVELGARLGGDFIATNLVPLSTGVDLVAATINWALGKDVDLQSRDNKFAAIRYLSNLENVHFNNEIIKELEYFSWNRLSVNELKSSRDREGLFIVSDITREKMEEKIEKIRDSIHSVSYTHLDVYKRQDYDLSPAINSYGNTFFKQFKYLSDSRMRWRENIEDIIEADIYKRLHILTHAFWYDKDSRDIKKTLFKFIKQGNSDRYDILGDNITDLKSLVKKDEV